MIASRPRRLVLRPSAFRSAEVHLRHARRATGAAHRQVRPLRARRSSGAMHKNIGSTPVRCWPSATRGVPAICIWASSAAPPRARGLLAPPLSQNGFSRPTPHVLHVTFTKRRHAARSSRPQQPRVRPCADPRSSIARARPGRRLRLATCCCRARRHQDTKTGAVRPGPCRRHGHDAVPSNAMTPSSAKVRHKWTPCQPPRLLHITALGHEVGNHPRNRTLVPERRPS